uniref:Glucosylceramidase n=1 Tax=Stegastes partitus TaxID=144197 RepID=A0A3B5BA58_9TELE
SGSPSPFLFLLRPGSSKCISRNFGHDSVVCECNSTYCDSIGPVRLPPVGRFSSYLSSLEGSRLEAGEAEVQVNGSSTGLRLTLVSYQKYQKVRGFGGSMTDAAAMNILSLSAGSQEQLLRQYFSSEASFASRWPAATSPPACTPTPTRLETTAWTTSPWQPKTSI